MPNRGIERPGYYKTEIGWLPLDWIVVPIGKVVKLSQYGLSIASDAEGSTPIIGMKNLVSGKVLLNDLAKVSIGQEDVEKFRLLPGDILLNRTNSYDLVGKVAIYDSNQLAVFASYLVRFQFNTSQILPEFVDYFLNSNPAQQRLKKLATKGVSQANINPTVFKEQFLIPVPSIQEQKRIAEILATWDEAIALTERAIEAKQNLRTALLSKLLNFEKSHQTKIGEISQVKSGSTPLRANYESYFKAGTVPWVKTMDLNNGFIYKTAELITDTAIKQTACSVFPKGTVLVAMYGGFNQIGRTGLLKIDAAVNQAISAIQVDKSIVLPEYLLQYLNAKVDYWKRFAASSRKDPNITRKDVCDFPIVVPSLLEQRKIVDVLEASDHEISLLHQYCACLQRQKRGLMQKLLTGEWRVAVQEAA
ncbi:MAG: restriction endonuclease subunit S [Kastovskya adunca ATA6-11-RM4]|jgi:type I restriction enzyme S subunit|nr:restriction endonuclease subunit S [Kastovskya adunca ATA6-11-RM4]